MVIQGNRAIVFGWLGAMDWLRGIIDSRASNGSDRRIDTDGAKDALDVERKSERGTTTLRPFLRA